MTACDQPSIAAPEEPPRRRPPSSPATTGSIPRTVTLLVRTFRDKPGVCLRISDPENRCVVLFWFLSQTTLKGCQVNNKQLVGTAQNNCTPSYPLSLPLILPNDDIAHWLSRKIQPSQTCQCWVGSNSDLLEQ